MFLVVGQYKGAGRAWWGRLERWREKTGEETLRQELVSLGLGLLKIKIH